MKIKKIALIIIGILAAWFVLHTVYIVVDGLTDKNKKADYAVVLGNKVTEDGTLSERMQKRMECALHLYNNQRVNGIIVSGGLGKEGYYEADKMKEYLTTHGVPDAVIIVDNDGTNTRKTVDNTLQLQDSLQYSSLIVVSQYFHVTRTKMLFRKNGFTQVSSASPCYFEMRDIYSILREFAGYYTQLI